MNINKLVVNMHVVYQESNSFFRYDSKIYDLNKVFQITSKFPIFLFPVQELMWLLDDQFLSSERVEEANLSYPIIISTLGNKFIVLDGVHRLAKAIDAGMNDITVKYICPDLFTGFALPTDHPIYTYNMEYDNV